jgi:hypothetical protein
MQEHRRLMLTKGETIDLQAGLQICLQVSVKKMVERDKCLERWALAVRLGAFGDRDQQEAIPIN